MTTERIPPLLRKRIEALKGSKWEMSEELFRRATSGHAAFDRIFVWQYPEDWYGGDCYAGTNMLKPPATLKRQEQNTPRGIIISAGLSALDALRSNGIDVGHIVHFCVNAPYRRPLDDNDQKHLVLLRAGDIVDSEDLARALDDGDVAVNVNKDGQHVLVDASGNAWVPRLPWMED